MLFLYNPKFKIIAFAVLLVVFSVGGFVHAQGIDVEEALGDSPGIEDFTIQKLANVITGLVCWVSGIAIVLTVLALVWFGMMFITSRGDPGKVTEARKSFLWGLVGIAVIFGVYTIIATVANSLGLDYSFIPLDCPSF